MSNLLASSLEKALASGQPVITAEITPPVGADPSHALEMAEGLRGQVQAFNVTDGSRAVMGMSSLALCRLLLERGLLFRQNQHFPIFWTWSFFKK